MTSTGASNAAPSRTSLRRLQDEQGCGTNSRLRCTHARRDPRTPRDSEIATAPARQSQHICCPPSLKELHL